MSYQKKFLYSGANLDDLAKFLDSYSIKGNAFTGIMFTQFKIMQRNPSYLKAKLRGLSLEGNQLPNEISVTLSYKWAGWFWLSLIIGLVIWPCLVVAGWILIGRLGGFYSRFTDKVAEELDCHLKLTFALFKGIGAVQ